MNKPKKETDKIGYTPGWFNSEMIDFQYIYVASPSDSAATINAKLSESGIRGVVFQPGIYQLEEAIQITKNSSVVLGLGLATLIPINGTSAIEVTGVGCSIASVLLEAGPVHSDTLLKLGTTVSRGNFSYPNLLADIFARSGRFYASSQAYTSADKFVQVNTGYTVIDNVWLWRADHDYYGLVVDS